LVCDEYGTCTIGECKVVPVLNKAPRREDVSIAQSGTTP